MAVSETQSCKQLFSGSQRTGEAAPLPMQCSIPVKTESHVTAKVISKVDEKLLFYSAHIVSSLIMKLL